MDLRKITPGQEWNRVYNLLLEHMKITIDKKKLLVFDDKIIDSKYCGFKLEDNDKFSCDKDDAINLRYSLSMDTELGNELQNLSPEYNFQ